MKIRLSSSFLTEAQPVLDDALHHSSRTTDSHLIAMAPIARKIATSPADRDGYVAIDVTPEEAQTLVVEASYRASACRDRAADAYDNRERMSILGTARGCDGVAKRARAIVEAAS